ncbi:phosphate/phosphite/phosphonate ABC transporter substrate-binding protein [Erwinia oleae]|uniref:phosphate/phosphite/phosphonate ABC transporter substrate-binding protein n=1 Tax=Erwinia oleae TaxID=796334 RepID=UPI000689E5C0|nr:PhnD/SsuA/transferrin family substrate-binding protein [Erwinia oleae]
MTALPSVQVVGAFHYGAPGCDGAHYRSWIVARETESGDSLAAFRQRRLACNSEDSQSGYRALMKLTDGPVFFAATEMSGSHRRSLALLRENRADVAAIDCVSWALIGMHFPQETRGLKIIGQTASVPGLPLITSADTPPTTLAALRSGLRDVVSAPQNKTLLAALLIKDFSVLPREAWRVVLP